MKPDIDENVRMTIVIAKNAIHPSSDLFNILMRPYFRPTKAANVSDTSMMMIAITATGFENNITAVNTAKTT